MSVDTKHFGFITDCCGEFPIKDSEDWGTMNGRCKKCGDMMPLILDDITDKKENKLSK